MRSQNKWIFFISSSLIVLLLIIGVILFYLGSVLFIPQQENTDQQGNALKLPVLLEDLNPDPDVSDFVLDVQAGQTNFGDRHPTATLGYNGSYLGPVIQIKKGEQVNIQVNNHLSVPTTVHWHGLVVDGEQDGGPHQGIQPGESWKPSFIVDQSAATLWFHPHLMGATADQVYYGLAGLMYITDDFVEQLNLPREYGVNDIPLIIQDRSFNNDGSFNYQTNMMGVIPGDTILVNGTVHPYLDLKKSVVKFRLLNASNAQNFEFSMSDGHNFLQIASDGGLLEKTLTRQTVFLAPGERAEVILDFGKVKGSKVSLMVNQSPVLVINLSNPTDDPVTISNSLTVINPIPIGNNPIKRVFELQSMGSSGTINGKFFDMNRIDEEVGLNVTEIWIIRNRGGMMQTGGHPFHVHGTQFQIISRNGQSPPREEQGYKDTVYVQVGEEVAIRVRFTHPGIFMYHCHILEHEDNGMMGQFRVQ